jgi:hypothetical protein
MNHEIRWNQGPFILRFPVSRSIRLACTNRQTARSLLFTGKPASSKVTKRREKSEPSFRSQRTPEQEGLAFQVVINKDGYGVDLSFAFHSCSFSRSASCPGLGGCVAM